jgi:hypothetical protein
MSQATIDFGHENGSSGYKTKKKWREMARRWCDGGVNGGSK